MRKLNSTKPLHKISSFFNAVTQSHESWPIYMLYLGLRASWLLPLRFKYFHSKECSVYQYLRNKRIGIFGRFWYLYYSCPFLGCLHKVHMLKCTSYGVAFQAPLSLFVDRCNLVVTKVCVATNRWQGKSSKTNSFNKFWKKWGMLFQPSFLQVARESAALLASWWSELSLARLLLTASTQMYIHRSAGW